MYRLVEIRLFGKQVNGKELFIATLCDKGCRVNTVKTDIHCCDIERQSAKKKSGAPNVNFRKISVGKTI